MKNADKTLIILVPAFPESESATHWIPFMQSMIKGLKETDRELNIIVLSFLYPAAASYQWHGITVKSFGGIRKRNLQRIALWRRIWNTLKTLKRQHTIIGVFSFWCGECAFVGKRFAKKYSIKHICWICGQDARKSNKWIWVIRPKAHELAAMSWSLANEFYKNHGIIPAHIIPNAIDPLSFPPTTIKDIDIIAAGSLVPLKQYDILINVVNVLVKQFPLLKVVHCGEGSDHGKITAMIAQYQLNDNVQLLGNKSHEEVLMLMQRSKILLHPSGYEGLSTVCLEALYAGAHVISFCYPFERAVNHWHVVRSTEEMIAKATTLLQAANTDYSPVLVHSMNDSAAAVMKLFATNTDQ